MSKSTSTKNAILKGKILPTLLKLSFPIMLNQLLQTAYNLSDSYFMGKLGSQALSASAFTFPIFQTLTSLGAGFGVGGMIIFSRNIGAGKYEENDRAKSQLITVNLLISLLITIITVVYSKEILQISGAKDELLNLSNNYMQILFTSAPFLFIINAYNAIENSKGKTVKPMLLVLASTILNVLLNSLFLKMGMGIEGIAIATVIASVILSVYTIYDMAVRKKDIFLKYMKLDSKLALSIIKLGIPVSLSSATANVGFIVLNRYVVEYGSAVLAAYGIGNRINNIFYTPANGICTGVSIMVAQNLGAENYRRARKVFKQAMLVSLLIGAIGSFLLIAFDLELTKIFTDDIEITKHTIDYISIFAFSNAPWAIYQVIIGYFQGEGLTKLNFYINLGRVWIFRIPVLIFIQNIFNLGTFSLWYAMLVSNILVMLLVAAVYVKRHVLSNRYKEIGKPAGQ